VSATEAVDVVVTGDPGAASVVIAAGEPVSASLSNVGAGRYSVELGGVAHTVRIIQDAASIWVGDEGFSCELTLRTRAQQLADQLANITREAGPAAPDIRSPMPGTVIAVNVIDGQVVAEGETLLIVEAMKMEHQLTATVAGSVSISAKPGDVVKLDQIVATIHQASPTEATA
jgi:acetyl-CoA/propionyl-CoA carboxylase, biotin carboxylase, biotin carboxyl carrier protein